MFVLIPFVISSRSSVVILFSTTWFPLFFQLFPLLLDCLTFGFSYTPLLHLIDDQLSLLCGTIVLDDIVLGSNKNGGKLSRGNYVKAIYFGSIINGQFFGWQLIGGNYQWSLILWGNYLGVSFLGQLSWGWLSRGQLSCSYQLTDLVFLLGIWDHLLLVLVLGHLVEKFQWFHYFGVYNRFYNHRFMNFR